MDFVVRARVNAARSRPYIFRELVTEAASNLAYPLAEAGPKALRCSGLEISLIPLKIHHKTTYRFNKPVALGPTV